MKHALLAFGLFVAAVAFGSSVASAQGQMQWAAYDITDELGRRNASLIFGVPETDDVVIAAFCRPDLMGQVEVNLFIESGMNQAGQPVVVQFSSKTLAQTTRNGVMIDGAFGPYAQVLMPRNDPIWVNLRAENAAQIALAGATGFTTHLRGSNAAITEFFRICEAIAAPPPPAPGKPSGPTPPPPSPVPPPPVVGANAIGAWLLIVPKVGPCPSCTLAVATAGSSQSLVSSEGWVANVVWGANPARATGRGFWHAGTGAGTSFTVEVTVDNAGLHIVMTTEGGAANAQNYQRSGP